MCCKVPPKPQLGWCYIKLIKFKVVGADVFMINGKTLLWIVDYHSKFPIVKQVNSLSADDVVQMTKLICVE